MMGRRRLSTYRLISSLIDGASSKDCAPIASTSDLGGHSSLASERGCFKPGTNPAQRGGQQRPIHSAADELSLTPISWTVLARYRNTYGLENSRERVIVFNIGFSGSCSANLILSSWLHLMMDVSQPISQPRYMLLSHSFHERPRWAAGSTGSERTRTVTARLTR